MNQNRTARVPKESKEDRFVRLAEARVNKAIHLLRLIGNLSTSSTYAYHQEWAEQIILTLRTELARCEHRLRSQNKRPQRQRFSLSTPYEPAVPKEPHWIMESPDSYYCSSCGTPGNGVEPDENDLFCRYCGLRLSGEPERKYLSSNETDSQK